MDFWRKLDEGVGRRTGFAVFLAAVAGLISMRFWWEAGVPSMGFWDEDFLFLLTGHQGLRIFLKDLATPHAIGTFRPWGHQLYFLLGRTIFGLSPRLFHFFQLFLHSCNTALVFSLLVALGDRKFKDAPKSAVWISIAGMAALLWSIHCSSAQAVAWIAATNNEWLGFFFLLFLLGFLCEWGRGKILFFYFMALMSKEFAILGVPAIFCFCEVAQIRRQKKTIVFLVGITLLFLAYFSLMNVGFSSDYRFRLSLNSWEAIKTYIGFTKESYSSSRMLMLPENWALTAVIALFGLWGGAGPLLFFVGGLVFLSAWPQHVRGEFLYMPLVGLYASIFLSTRRLFLRFRPSAFIQAPFFAALLWLLVIAWGAGQVSVGQYVAYFRERSLSYVRADALLVQVKGRMSEPADSPFWLELSRTLGARGSIFVGPYLEVFHPEIYFAYPCFEMGVDLNVTPRLSPEVFLKCGH